MLVKSFLVGKDDSCHGIENPMVFTNEESAKKVAAAVDGWGVETLTATYPEIENVNFILAGKFCFHLVMWFRRATYNSLPRIETQLTRVFPKEVISDFTPKFEATDYGYYYMVTGWDKNSFELLKFARHWLQANQPEVFNNFMAKKMLMTDGKTVTVE